MNIQAIVHPVRSCDGETSEETCQPQHAEAWRLSIRKDEMGLYDQTFFYPNKKRAEKARRQVIGGMQRPIDQGMGKDWLPSRGLIHI